MNLLESLTSFTPSTYSLADFCNAWRMKRRWCAAYRELLNYDERLLRDMGIERATVLAALEEMKGIRFARTLFR